MFDGPSQPEGVMQHVLVGESAARSMEIVLIERARIG